MKKNNYFYLRNNKHGNYILDLIYSTFKDIIPFKKYDNYKYNDNKLNLIIGKLKMNNYRNLIINKYKYLDLNMLLIKNNENIGSKLSLDSYNHLNICLKKYFQIRVNKRNENKTNNFKENNEIKIKSNNYNFDDIVNNNKNIFKLYSCYEKNTMTIIIMENISNNEINVGSSKKFPKNNNKLLFSIFGKYFKKSNYNHDLKNKNKKNKNKNKNKNKQVSNISYKLNENIHNLILKVIILNIFNNNNNNKNKK